MLEKTNSKKVGLIVILIIALSIGPVSDLSAQTSYAQGCANAKQGSSFMEDYLCFPSGGSGSTTSPAHTSEPTQTSAINWEDLCNQYGGLVGITSPCSEFAQGTVLTQRGQTVLVCLFGGALTFLSSLDPATKAAIFEAGKTYCPK
jgi:hypothetical protein